MVFMLVSSSANFDLFCNLFLVSLLQWYRNIIDNSRIRQMFAQKTWEKVVWKFQLEAYVNKIIVQTF